MIYYNKEKNKFYTGGSLNLTLKDGSVCFGVPTPEQLAECGYEEYTEPSARKATDEESRVQRMQDIIAELFATDYLALKAFEGEDMSEHPGWKEYRAQLRVEYRQLEAQQAAEKGDDSKENDNTP